MRMPFFNVPVLLELVKRSASRFSFKLMYLHSPRTCPVVIHLFSLARCRSLLSHLIYIVKNLYLPIEDCTACYTFICYKMMNEDWTVEVLFQIREDHQTGDNYQTALAFALHHLFLLTAHLVKSSSENCRGPYSFSSPSSIQVVTRSGPRGVPSRCSGCPPLNLMFHVADGQESLYITYLGIF